MSSLIRAAAATLAAVAIAPATVQAQELPSVSFTWVPKAPTTADDVTFTATTSAAEVTWDFDADGHPDASGMQVVHRFGQAGTHRVRATANWPGAVPIVRDAVESVTVTSVAGATPTPTPTPTLAPPPPPAPTPAPCQTVITAGKLKATAMCFNAAGSSFGPVNINGMTVTPLDGKSVTVRTGRGVTITSDKARVTITVKGAPATLFTGKLDWKLVNDQLEGFTFTPSTLGGMRIVSMPQPPTLTASNKTRLKLHFKLPDKLGGATTSSPVNIEPGSSAPVSFTIKHGGLPGMSLSSMTVTHESQTTWSIEGKVALPHPVPLTLGASIGVKDNSFSHLYTNSTFGASGPNFGPLTLRKLSFNVVLDPKPSPCVPKLGKETVDMKSLLKQTTGEWFNVKPVVIDHGYPQAAMCGDISLTAGPTLLGKPALVLEGGMGFKVYKDRPSVLRAYGTAKLVGFTLTDAEMEFHGNGYARMSSRYEMGWSGVAALRGWTQLEFRGKKFNGEGYQKACLDFIDYCLGARGLMSSKGIAVCLIIDTFVGDWHPGFGVRWGHKATLYWKGCDLGPYRENLSASASGVAKTVRFGKGLPGAVVALTGKGAPPRVALIGPRGERIEVPEGLTPAGGKGWFVMKSPNENLTQIAIATPSAGTWRIEVLPGSAPLMKVASAEGLHKPSVKAKVRGGKLRYTIKPIPGQVVRFVERGPSAGGEIGVARGARGTLRFKPAPGRAERRQIVALVEQDGQLRDRIVVATYKAPGINKPAAVKRLKLRRAGKSIVATWAGAKTVQVRAELSDGRVLLERMRGHRFTFKATGPAKVSVRALSAAGLMSRPATAKVR
jgi:hypothetical protein